MERKMKKHIIKFGAILLLSIASTAFANTERPDGILGVHDGIINGCSYSAKSSFVNTADHCQKCVTDSINDVAKMLNDESVKSKELIDYMAQQCVDKSSQNKKDIR
jgi:hypothetical protein